MKRIIFAILILSVFLVGCEEAQPPLNTFVNSASMGVGVVIGNGEEPIEEPGEPSTPPTANIITTTELAMHDEEGDCWIVYEGQVYDYSETKFHPDIADTFYRHCGKISGFEEGAIAKHRQSSPERVANYGTYIGDLQ